MTQRAGFTWADFLTIGENISDSSLLVYIEKLLLDKNEASDPAADRAGKSTEGGWRTLPMRKG